MKKESIAQVGWRVLLLALAYVVTGRLALLLAIPPGFATAIFPPVGVGLAAVLLWGDPMVAGVLLGSTVLNLSISWSAGGGFSWRGLLVAFGIAMGSSLHNAVGAALIRRFVGFPTSLRNESEVIPFLLLGGPIACLISATWGVTVLYLAGAVTGPQYAFSWWTWWVGDATGVLIGTPLMLVLFAKPAELWVKRRATVGLPLLIGCFVVVGLFIRASRLEQQNIATRFDERAKLMTTVIQSKFASCKEIVLLVERFLTAAPQSRRNEFSTFVTKLRASHPELQAMTWVARVREDERKLFEQQIRDEGFSSFVITERDATGQFITANTRPEHYVVTYLEPLAPNRPAFGYDLTSDAIRYAATSWGRDHDDVALTAPVELVQSPLTAVVLFHPVYSGVPANEAERRAQLRGFVSAVLSPKILVEGALAGYSPQDYDLLLHDVTNAKESPILVRTNHDDSQKDASSFGYRQSWTIGNRALEIVITPTASFIQAQRSLQAWAVLAAGLGLCSLLGAFLLVVSGRTSHVEQLVEQRTQELSAVLDNATEAIITFDAHGYIERANPATAELFEEPLKTLLTRRITDLIPEIDWHVKPSGDGVQEVRGYRANGKPLTLEMTLSQMDIRGRTLYTAMLHDISARKEAERLKNEFVSTVSHELRTPLTSIFGSLGLISGGVVGDVPEGIHELVEIARVNAERLTLLVNDILDIDKIAAGNLQVDCESTDLRVIIRQSLVQNRGYADRYGVGLGIDETQFVTEPVMVHVDSSRILQVMANLLSNAIKFSPHGQTVDVSLTVVEGKATVGVHDRGPGIPESFRGRIFEKFAQADGANTRRSGGTGLGLSISKAIIERFGGTIGFDSSPGSGSTFYFVLPLVTPEV